MRCSVALLAIVGVSCIGSAPDSGASGEDVPVIDAVPEDGLPAGLELENGYAQYQLPDGRRVVVVAADESAPHEPEPVQGDDEIGASEQALSSTLGPTADTWARVTPAGSTDFGRSCELRVNNIVTAPNSERNMALLRFTLPPIVTCATISSATLQMKTAQAPTGGLTLVVFPHRITSPWNPGTSGASTCSSCNVATGSSAAFQVPSFTTVNSPVPVNSACTTYNWDVTSLVQGGGGWCFAPGNNHGVLMGGRNGVVTVKFHSSEAPAADRPKLVIVF